MEITYDNLVNWFDGYFKAFNKYAGVPETIPNMEKYFTDDLQFKHYMGSSAEPSTRDDLLHSMLHPGVHEELTPLEFLEFVGKVHRMDPALTERKSKQLLGLLGLRGQMRTRMSSFSRALRIFILSSRM